MKKLIFFLSFYALSFGVEREKLKVFVFDFPPLVIDEGQGGGLGPEILKVAADRAGVEIEFEFLPVKRALKLYHEKEGLILATRSMVASGDPVFLHMMTVRTGLFGLVGKSGTGVTAYLRGLKRAKDYALAHSKSTLPVQNYRAAIKALRAGRVQAIVGMNTAFNHALINRFPDMVGKVRLLSKAMTLHHGGVIAHKRHSKIIVALKNEIKKMREEGLLSKLIVKHIGPYLGSVKLGEYLEAPPKAL